MFPLSTRFEGALCPKKVAFGSWSDCLSHCLYISRTDHRIVLRHFEFHLLVNLILIRASQIFILTLLQGVNLGVLSGFLLAGFITFVPNSRHYPHLPVESNCTQTFKNVLNASMPAEDSYLLAVNTTDFSRVTPPPPPPKAFPPE